MVEATVDFRTVKAGGIVTQAFSRFQFRWV
jgi:hypothetical protein